MSRTIHIECLDPISEINGLIIVQVVCKIMSVLVEHIRVEFLGWNVRDVLDIIHPPGLHII